MKTYDQLRFSLMTEFKLLAAPHLRSLWADLMTLEEASDESAFFEARGQTLRRLRALSLAAGAANAWEVQTLVHALKLLVVTTTQVRDAANYERFDALYKEMRELTKTVHGIKAAPPLSERERQPAEMALIESCTDQRRHPLNSEPI